IKIKKYFWRVILIVNSVIISLNIMFAHPVLAKTLEENPAKGKEMIPFYWMILIVGSCIAVTLSYVSWRKYKGEQQRKKKNKYKIYSKKPTSSMMSGAQVARKILDENGLYDVNVEETKGFLSDHYDPRKKVVRLSSNNYHGQSMASSAVAAHEVGHAIQDQQEYAFLRFRTALVPVASLGSNMSIFLILGGIL